MVRPLSYHCIHLNSLYVCIGLREAKRLHHRLKQFYASNPVENYGEANKLEEMTLDDAYDELEDDDDDDDTDDDSVDMNSDESMINDQEKTSTSNGRSKLIDRSANKNGPMPVYRHIRVDCLDLFLYILDFSFQDM